jgi:osmotically-inducible protein OsmY
MTRRTLLALLLIAGLTTAAYPGRKGSRYDEEIRSAVANILKSHSELKNVKTSVDDNVVTLAGSVELDSTRENLFNQVKHIKHVHSVRNELVLDPPAPPDQTLYGRIRQTLADIRLETVKFRVHEGAVTLSGIVRNEKERQRAIEMVRSTAGVKEVRSQLTIAGY